MVSQLGDLSLIRSTRSANGSRSRRLERHIADDDARHIFVCMPLAGDITVHEHGQTHARARTHRIGNDHLALLDSDHEYETAMSDELDAIWLRIPENLFSANVLPADVLPADDMFWKPLAANRGLGFIAKRMMQDATAEDAQLGGRGARMFGQSLVSFLGEVVNTQLQPEGAAMSRGRRKILERARDYIEEHIHEEDLTPAAIAKGIGISPRYLSEVFAAEGSTPMRWVRTRRLELCRMELERQGAGQQRICEIAYSMGFTNVSSFNRAFKAQFGCSPRAMSQPDTSRD